jgi:hypothetical protein
MVPSRGRRDGECGVIVCVCVFCDETFVILSHDCDVQRISANILSLQMLQFSLR